MAQEIERKFLLRDDRWRGGAPGAEIRQGYLQADAERTVRVRIAGSRAFLTVKGPIKGVSRLEFEYAVPVSEARQMLELCRRPLIEKTRYRIEHAGMVWEVDEFHGENAGLVLAEIELSAENQTFEKPAWVGTEVTGDFRYYNSSLMREPYSRWKRE